MNKIIVRRNAPNVDALSTGLHPVLARVFAARGVSSPDELDYSLERLHPHTLFAGMEGAVQLLAEALAQGQRIVIVGDFDADGATSCAVAVKALRLMGAREVGYLVPDRFRFGYGLTPEIVELAAAQHPDLIVTVDNGISSLEGVARARAQGIRVLVTDHHLPGETLPAADAIVNPNQPGCPFPSKHLAGVGVIFYTMLALRAHLREQGWFDPAGCPEPNLAQLLDLVALGTVADVVPLDANNRTLVSQGLARIRAGRACPGVQALIQVAGRCQETLTTSDLGFAVGPRLNAAGRLESMSLGIDCLLSDSLEGARSMAARLDELNRERRAIEAEMQDQALASLQDILDRHREPPDALCLFDPNWHQGVIGILAARIRERLHRPVIAFACADENELKGSARSVPGLHIRDALDAIAAHHPHLLRRFGGHAMAAGLTLQRDHLDEFREAFAAEVGRRLDDDLRTGTVHSDGELQGEDLTRELAELLRHASPWGAGFPEPLFDGEFTVVTRRVVGERHLKLRLAVPASPVQLDAIAFNQADLAVEPGVRVHALYGVEINDFQGRSEVQLRIQQLAILNGATTTGEKTKRRRAIC